MIRATTAALTLAGVLAANVSFATTVLLQEQFEGITGFQGGLDPRIFGVPVAGNDTPYTIVSADNSWYAARFERPDSNNPIHTDVGAQRFGGDFFGPYANNSIVGVAEDDAGLVIGIDTRGYTDIRVQFDWRTFSTTSADRIIVGYFVGDLLSVAGTHYDAVTRSFDLRNAANGGQDGLWNWSPQDAGAVGSWVELMRGQPQANFTREFFDLAGAEDGQVWLAFWLDNGEGDFAKFDNILVTGLAIVPLPGALPLLLSGLAVLGAAARRRRSIAGT